MGNMTMDGGTLLCTLSSLSLYNRGQKAPWNGVGNIRKPLTINFHPFLVLENAFAVLGVY